VKTTRREFLVGMSALPLAAHACAPFRYVPSQLENGRLVVSKEEFGAGTFALVEAPNYPLPIYLYRHDDGAFTAVLTRCMHRGCQVEPAEGHLVCPCHGSEYDNAGAVLKGPTQLPLIRFPVTADARFLYIALDQGTGQ
jgi:cytochrome b6-f complex iron-sulfur subunit